MGHTILKNATIIDCTGADPKSNGWVVIQDQRIKEVGHGRTGALPAQTTVIDCQGQTLLPGLIDAHTTYFKRPRFYARLRERLKEIGVIS